MLVLVCVFSVAIIIRAFPAKYGFFLNEFDPYYDYKAANFIVTSFDNSWKSGGGGFPGLLNYFSWTDTTTWFPDRKSTRLNSSHVSISYAVFCLKKKKNPVELRFAPTSS